ncbi:undecaprenyldiphospho-muramoylpentapeptide beta-N-acetylglucosaminyltransferase [uncultured Anaerococcus sp.]|uniref:undecaprenyldiphospho-muramoylpentapeptide beta-N-acetylglucosaminyltransferase n=1 Tax=uncultured Anaerococcus sp. TaxID=293428 RepID=UPI00288A457F|nr:undecaprenyldiphospho-muramoylpentapeptide beta-N-acetylglucosaminyltransferase [uncultured Anaerococcus sp.]
MRVILSGGGTGGHIYPAIAIGQKIREENPDADIIYVGIKGGPEEKIAQKNGYEFKAIDAMGLPRKINKRLFKAIFKNLKGFKEAKEIIKNFKPDLVIGTGGYVCAPILYQASKAKIPSIVHESNSYPGMASKFLSKKVDRVLISYKEAAKHFKNQANIVVTGNPVRNNFSLSYTDEDLKKLGIDKSIPVVFSFGGSNGSFALNKAVIEMSKDMNGEFFLLHQTGNRFYDDFLEKCEKSKYIKAFKYIDNIDLFYAVSDLVIASSGAMSLAEISSVGRPSILIPKAYTTENHQEYNARTYVDHGASLMILEKDLTSSYLKTQIMSIIKDEQKIKNMGEKACELADNHALDKSYQQIKELI